jgi:carbonic anhydrase/acetyltransferase-like protein (isoleucine patch superfamily)
MNSVVMDDCIIGDECIVGALSFVPAESNFKARSLIVGNPAKKIKEVSDQMIQWKSKGTKLYQALPRECFESLVECEPLREIETDRPKQETMYTTWNSLQNNNQSS